MLETKELYKIYKPKKGVPVEAINKVSLKFPDTGMVFLLGKSGSGKSTLLNLLGGLDKYDGGEIIINGVSSAAFKQQHFDSYRNTYVGFIFQEYNVLDEFSVGANIALAIELQNRKADEKEINAILDEVDLNGYGTRKPNELSGGQKQRVAIARALVKNPQIIMADEPTGALDSLTGRQVFDTLKKLSKSKLVIVVSHDREFAEQYADRIIELSDGVVTSDVELDTSAPIAEQEPGLTYCDNVVEVSRGYQLTEEDRKAINEYIEKLSADSLEITAVRKGRSSRRFTKTDESKIAARDGASFKLIKSKLPLKNAFKIGGSGLKHKKIRLVFTIFLSFIAFALFGLSDTLGAYNHIRAATNSLVDTEVSYTSLAKSRKVGTGVTEFWNTGAYSLTADEIEKISKDTGISLRGIYVPMDASLGFERNIDLETEFTKSQFNLYSTTFSGMGEVDEAYLKKLGYSLAEGKLPDGAKDEIAISDYIFATLKLAKYTDGTTETGANGEIKPVFQTIVTYKDMIGKVLDIGGKKYTVTGIVDTGFDFSRYEKLSKAQVGVSTAEEIVNFVLYNEFNYASGYSYSGIMMVGNGYLRGLLENRPPVKSISNGWIFFNNEYCSIDAYYMANLSDIAKYPVIWTGETKTTLGEKELIITSDLLQNMSDSSKLITNDEGEIDYAATFKSENLAQFYMYGNDYATNGHIDEDGYKVVGVINVDKPDVNIGQTIIANDTMVKRFTEGSEGEYDFAIGTMPQGKDKVEELVAYCYSDERTVRYPIQTAVTYELDSINDVLKVLGKVFLYIGLGFALFAALMLANFIGTSISHKKHEIGILRAIGSRSNDVFRIFFAESFIIAAINFVLSSATVFAVVTVVNYVIRTRLGVLVTVLHFGPRQALLLMAVSLIVAALASFFPVMRIARKRPIDAIRNR